MSRRRAWATCHCAAARSRSDCADAAQHFLGTVRVGLNAGVLALEGVANEQRDRHEHRQRVARATAVGVADGVAVELHADADIACFECTHLGGNHIGAAVKRLGRVQRCQRGRFQHGRRQSLGLRLSADQRRQLQAQRARVGIGLTQVSVQAQGVELEADCVQRRGVADTHTSLQRTPRFIAERRRGLQLRAPGQGRAQVVLTAQGGQPGLPKRLGEVRPGRSAGCIGDDDAQRRFVTAFEELVDAQQMVEGFVPQVATPQIPAEVGRTQRQLRIGTLRGGEHVGARPGECPFGGANIGVARRHPCEYVANRQAGGAVVGKQRTGHDPRRWRREQDGNQDKKRGAFQTGHGVTVSCRPTLQGRINPTV
jgi:hypothetical protein